ncbi:nucleoside ABC transporter membrane protein [Treponema bryantii]|uniref:Nucleoside ABC transporter membrane protein n=1 Tax=Treponema bryantii TaxID=163 RepID=A0A1H9DK62_9SPIR|nr:ABC transporter permease [Treponema bryantii]SEQ13819.1 nucleoside ABC transporter membrane protein [Treponema bryantii]
MSNKFKTALASDTSKSILSAVICALLGILIGFIILLIINAEHAPKAISVILKNWMYYRNNGKKLYYLGQTLVKAVPLILCGIAVLFAYKSGLFNIGVAGQYCIGIGISLWTALAWHLPWFVCVLFAIVCAALWASIAGLLKAFCNVNEVIAGIMLNWISLYIVNVLMQNERVMNVGKSETFSIAATSPQSLLPTLGLGALFHDNEYVSIAIPLTIVVAILINILLKKTVLGYELRATGLNKHAAKYAGMKDKKNLILTMAVSGAIAGLAASLFYLTDVQPWKTSSTVPAMGFNGIAVAFLGELNPIGVIFSGYFIQHITQGGSFIDTKYFNPQIADLISSIIIYSCAFMFLFKTQLSKLMERKKKVAKSEEKPVKAESADAEGKRG